MSFASKAGNIEHVNVGRVVVYDQSISSQQNAGKQALAQTFIKLSGNKLVIEAPEIAKAIDTYEQFLISSSFIRQGHNLVFEASFSQAKVENLLLANGLSVWASLRPSAVLWLARENEQQQKELFSQQAFNDESQEISLKGFTRGIDVITPVGDLEDVLNVSVYDVWNQFISKLQSQSLRYDAEYLISATVQPYSNKAEGADKTSNILEGTAYKLDYIITNVDYTEFKQVEAGHIIGSSENDVMLQVIDVYADMLARKFASNTDSEALGRSHIVSISGIDSLEDYVHMMALVRSLPSVSNVRLMKQNHDVAILDVEQKTSISQLQSILSLDKRVIAVTNTPDAAASFRWQGD
jgi:hypothetical protein